MSSNCSPISRSWVAVAGLPLIHARLLPAMSTVRRSSKLLEWLSGCSNPALLSQPDSTSVDSNSALTSVRAAPSRITPGSARAPVTNCNASIRIDLPAPVSPVNTVKPLARSSSSSLTITKSRRTMRFSDTVRLPLHSSAISGAACQSRSSPAGAKSALGAESG